MVFLFGEIDKHLATKVTKRLLRLSSKSKEPIILVINSHGGDQGNAFDLVNTISMLDVPIVTVGHQNVSSAATVIFATGRVRLITSGTSMIHHGIKSTLRLKDELHTSQGMRKLAKTLQHQADEVDELFKNFLILATRDSKLTPRQLRKMITSANGEDIRFSDKEMKRRRLAHDILPSLQHLSAYIEKYLKK